MSAASLMLLAGFTLAFMAAAARTIAGEGVEGHAGKFKVSPSVVLGFAVLGIVFDVASLGAFASSRTRQESDSRRRLLSRTKSSVP